MSGALAPELAIAAALEKALKAINPAMVTLSENTAAKPPVVTVAYQEILFVLAAPGNVERGGSSFLQTGYMQVNTHFPAATGKNDAWAHARAIREAFNVEASFSADGVTTNIGRTPQILPGSNDPDGRYALTVRVFFQAEIPN